MTFPLRQCFPSCLWQRFIPSEYIRTNARNEQTVQCAGEMNKKNMKTAISRRFISYLHNMYVDVHNCIQFTYPWSRTFTQNKSTQLESRICSRRGMNSPYIFFFLFFIYFIYLYATKNTQLRVHILLEFIYVHFYFLDWLPRSCSLYIFICMKINKMAGCWLFSNETVLLFATRDSIK